jgi:hypothetical protein
MNRRNFLRGLAWSAGGVLVSADLLAAGVDKQRTYFLPPPRKFAIVSLSTQTEYARFYYQLDWEKPLLITDLIVRITPGETDAQLRAWATQRLQVLIAQCNLKANGPMIYRES